MKNEIDEYLAFGVQHIWVIDPQRKKASSYTTEGKRDSLDVLTTSNPNLTLKLTNVFAALAEDVD